MIIKNNWEDKDVIQHTDMNALANGITSINVYNEDMTALCNSARTIFPTSDMSYAPNTIRVYINGLRKRVWPGSGPTGNYDYTETVSSGIGTRVEFFSPPASGQILLVDYQKANV